MNDEELWEIENPQNPWLIKEEEQKDVQREEKLTKEKAVYLAMKDFYKEYNFAVNNLVILREFLNDIFNGRTDGDFRYDYPSLYKEKLKK